MALETTLNWYGDAKKKATEKGSIIALTKAGLLVQNRAKKFAPKDTRRLEKSILSEVHPARLKATVTTYLDAEQPYDYYQEFGTRYFRAQPYMRPALIENTKKIIVTFKAEVGKAIGAK